MITLTNSRMDHIHPIRAASAAPSNQRGVLLAVAVVVLCGVVLAAQAMFVANTPLHTTVKVMARTKPGTAAFTYGHAAHQHAQQLQQHTQQQQQEHQQQQQSLAELKQQHDQQTQLLFTMRQAQIEFQAGVEKLEELYEQLSNTIASTALGGDASQPEPLAASGTQQQQHQPENGTAQGVLCTVLRNEVRYVPEWVAFHLLMGATKIVIYNDNSTDGIKEAVSPFGDRVVIVDLKKNIGGVPEDLSVHRVGGRQDWSFNHCKTTYAPSNGTGWFGIWDIDEFVYPCVRQSLKLQGGNVLWNAYAASTKAGADGHALHCSIFGPNHKDVPQGNDTLVLANNIMRAPHPGTEPAAAAKAWEAVAEGCNKCGCCNNDYRKTIYDLSKVAKLRFNTHGPFNKEAVIDNSWQKPMAGLCCNHYQFKSTEEARAKASANLNDLYNKVTDTPDAKEHYTMLMDTLAWQYLPDLLQLLQQKGFRYKMPEVPLLIARD